MIETAEIDKRGPRSSALKTALLGDVAAL